MTTCRRHGEVRLLEQDESKPAAKAGGKRDSCFEEFTGAGRAGIPVARRIVYLIRERDYPEG